MTRGLDGADLQREAYVCWIRNVRAPLLAGRAGTRHNRSIVVHLADSALDPLGCRRQCMVRPESGRTTQGPESTLGDSVGTSGKARRWSKGREATLSVVQGLMRQTCQSCRLLQAEMPSLRAGPAMAPARPRRFRARGCVSRPSSSPPTGRPRTRRRESVSQRARPSQSPVRTFPERASVGRSEGRLHDELDQCAGARWDDGPRESNAGVVFV